MKKRIRSLFFRETAPKETFVQFTYPRKDGSGVESFGFNVPLTVEEIADILLKYKSK